MKINWFKVALGAGAAGAAYVAYKVVSEPKKSIYLGEVDDPNFLKPPPYVPAYVPTYVQPATPQTPAAIPILFEPPPGGIPGEPGEVPLYEL
jgi:hypothetical protein